MTTLGTNLIADCIFDFDDPEDVEGCTQEQRLELWGLQVGWVVWRAFTLF
jgi:kinesin family protein 4/21/27